MGNRPAARDRSRPLKVFVNDTERDEIERRAGMLNLSVSAYLRGVAIGTELTSAIDAGAIDNMAKTNADLGRLGGLLKMWLMTRRGEGATSAQVHQLFVDLQGTQQSMREAISDVRRGK